MNEEQRKQYDERIENQKKIIQDLSDEIKRLKPNAELIQGQWVTELVYYNVSVIKGKVRTSYEKRSLYIKDSAEKLVNNRYLSEEEARNAINKVMPMALEKFKEAKEAYYGMMKEQGFSVGFNYDGDSHGIYNEYEYINFTMDGFNFQFPLDD